MPFKEQKYKRDVVTLKQYGKENFKFTYHKYLRTAGLDVDDEKKAEKGSVNDSKLENNISRAKSTIFELAVCNDWDYFFTLTIDGQKYGRYDLEKYRKDLSQWFRNYGRLREIKIDYLLIPEKHENGAWHAHGFLSGLPVEHLHLFTLDEYLPEYIRKKLLQGGKVFNWKAYQKKFGFCDFEPIKNHEASAKYVTKYITKDLLRCVTETNAHLYYCSQGLNRAKVIKRGYFTKEMLEAPQFENDYVKTWWFNGSSKFPELLAEFIED